MIGVSIAMFWEEKSFKEDESFKIIGGSVYDYHNYQHFCYSQGNERFALIIGLTYLAKNTLMDWKRRITFNPQQCGGRPCIRGMRIRVTDVLDLLATGLSH